MKLADDTLAKDVLLYAYADNDMVKIDAYSKSEYEFQCTRNDGEEVPAPAVSNGVYTFTITDITKDVVATICYRSCTISFNNNGHGTETESQEVMEGLKISRPEDPIADGLLFVGWYEEPECKTAWNFVADLVKKDMVLYAKWVEGAIPGVFTVAGPNGQSDTEDVVKVVFSKGNLQAHYNGSGYNWTFASNQYEYIGNNKGNTTIDGQTNGAIVDLFVWTASGEYDDRIKQYGINTSSNNKIMSYTKCCDWGETIDDIGTWFTLSIDQWKYLFTSRPDADKKYGFATVNKKNGIIILPDVFIDPLVNENKVGADFVPQSTVGWSANVYSDNNWQKMQAAGAVFLPAAGNRTQSKVSYAGDLGNYWSSTPRNDDYVYYLASRSNVVSAGYGKYRGDGYSVRLVTEYK